ncbi:MAG: hypothetical protein WD688_11315 [Candidatus Binatia bacterium]
MEVFIKIAPQEFSRLRDRISSESPAHEALDKATPINHAIEGVLFEGYNIACDENQARMILEVAKECCPEIIRNIEEAIKLARPG